MSAAGIIAIAGGGPLSGASLMRFSVNLELDYRSVRTECVANSLAHTRDGRVRFEPAAQALPPVSRRPRRGEVGSNLGRERRAWFAKPEQPDTRSLIKTI